MRNPFLQKPLRILLYAIWWVLPSSIHSFVLWKTYNLTPQSVVMDSLVSFLIFAILGLSLWYMVKYSSNNIIEWQKILQNHLIALGIVFLIWMGVSYALLMLILPSYNIIFSETVLWRFLLFLPVYLLIIFSYYLFATTEKVKDQEIQKSRLQALIREAEFDTLKAQINPHFLFNSLNSVSSLTISNPTMAREMIINISDFFRFTLLSSKKSFTTLGQELEHALLYLEIEKGRFGEKIQVDCSLPDEMKSVELPSLILQPLVENAVKHGVYESSTEIKISISFEHSGDNIKIKIANAFDSKSGSSKKGTGTGLKNVSSLLKNAYGKDDLLLIEKSANEFAVTLWIPKEKVFPLTEEA